MATIFTTLLSTVGCNIYVAFMHLLQLVQFQVGFQAYSVFWGHLTGFLSFELCLHASLGNAKKSISKIKSVLMACVLAFV